MRYVRNFEQGVKEMQAQVFYYTDRLGVIVAEEYARAAFRFFVAALPIATGLLQHSASVRVMGSSKSVDSAVLQDGRGQTSPVTAWLGDHWRTRVAYGNPEKPHLVKVKLIVREAFLLKKTGISGTNGRFGLEFHAGRSTFAEPEFVAFLRRLQQKDIENGKPPREFQEYDVAKLHAVTVLTRSHAMRGYLNEFIDEAKMNIERRASRLRS